MKHLKLFESFNNDEKSEAVNVIFFEFILKIEIPERLPEIFDTTNLKIDKESDDLTYYLVRNDIGRNFLGYRHLLTKMFKVYQNESFLTAHIAVLSIPENSELPILVNSDFLKYLNLVFVNIVLMEYDEMLAYYDSGKDKLYDKIFENNQKHIVDFLKTLPTMQQNNMHRKTELYPSVSFHKIFGNRYLHDELEKKLKQWR
jgi:hypothetical protein